MQSIETSPPVFPFGVLPDVMRGKNVLVLDPWLGRVFESELADRGATAFIEHGVTPASELLKRVKVDFAILHCREDINHLVAEFIERELDPRNIRYLLVSTINGESPIPSRKADKVFMARDFDPNALISAIRERMAG